MSNDDTQPVSQPTGAAPVAYAPAPAPRQPGRHRGRLLLAGGAVGIALVAGAGGFALGHVTADDERDGPGRFLRQGQDGSQGTFPGGPQGTFPRQGQPGQPPPGFPDPRDGGGDRQQPG